MRCRQATSPFSRGGKGDGAKQGKGVGDFRGIIVFLQLLWEWQYSVQREEQARQGCLSVCAQVLCKDAKPTKHTQTLILRKARGIVRIWKGWCGARVGAAIPPVVARIFSGDSTSPLTRGARVLVVFEGWCGFARVGAAIYLLSIFCTATEKIGYCAVPD